MDTCPTSKGFLSFVWLVGCACCLTSRCKCKKADNYVDLDVSALDVATYYSLSPDIVNIEVDDLKDCDNASDGSDDDLEQEVDEIMTNIYGDCDWADDHSGPEGDSDIASNDGMNPEFDS